MICEKLNNNDPFTIKRKDGCCFNLYNIALDLTSTVLAQHMIGSSSLFGSGWQADTNRIAVSKFGRSQIQQFGTGVQYSLRFCSTLCWRISAYNWRL